MPGSGAFSINEMGELVMGKIDEIGVVDVYELASDIGKECEKIMDLHGPNAVTNLMPKVINTLELLELLAAKNERDNTKMSELNDKISKLEVEKIEKAEYRKRFELEIEAIEDQWRVETQELVDLVSNLQNENKRILKQHEDIQAGSVYSSGIGESLTESGNFMSVTENDEFISAFSDTHVIQSLKDKLYKQREELKEKNEDIEAKRLYIDNANIQIERLKTSGNDYQRRYKLVQEQVKVLYEERADFLAQLQDQQRELHVFKKKLGLAEKENEDLVHSYNDDDPCRPRYTTAELKELFEERGRLVSQVDELTHKLNELKKDQNVEEEEEEIKNESNDEEDPPVQGPMPFEPDDAPWKRSSESGIRKFFRKLFIEPGQSSSSFNRRSLSTLSKMTLSSNNYVKK